MLFSTLNNENGAELVNFQVANDVPGVVPEPRAVLLLGAAVLALAVSLRRAVRI